ncbi:hypothetical protein HYS31_04485 [Candidatus Woesearchaeota archaeon]|nr:hypothetical protein [Candidatus Woesearchaeota archaeon]
MQVKDLKPKEGNIDIVVDIVDVGEAREFQKFGKMGRVATALAKDDTGDIKFTLWNDDIDKVKAGDKVHLTNGYVNEWQGEMQLTTGRMGKMEIVGKAEPSEKKDSDSAIRSNIPAQGSEEGQLNVEEENIEDVDDEEI